MEIDPKFNMKGDYFYVVDRNFNVLAVNFVLQMAFGLSPSTSNTCKLEDFIYREDLGKTRQYLEGAFRGGAAQSVFESHCIFPNGELKKISWQLLCFENKVFVMGRLQEKEASGTSQGLELAMDEKTIRLESEKKFQETFEYTGVAIAHVGFDGHIYLANQELCSILNYSSAELCEMNYFSILSPDDIATPQNLRENLFSGVIDRIVRERALLRKDGGEVWMLVTTTAVRDASGKAKYFIVAHKDITKRREIENSLRTSEENFRILSEAIPQIVWTANAKGKIEYFNRRWFEYTGMTEEDALSAAWQIAVHPEDFAACMNQWDLSVTTGAEYVNERRFKRAADGMYRWHLGRAVPVRNSKGQIFKWFGTCTDVHDQKVAEEERSKALIGERVAQENARMKSEFLATMSHEIRTPLNSVVGMTEILLDSNLDSEQYECAETIKNSAEILLTLVNDVLDLSKIEAGHLDLDKTHFDLKRVVSDVIQEISWAAEQKGVRIVLDISPKTPLSVQGDRFRIRQVLSNLMTNALKFTSEGQILLKIAPVEIAVGSVQVEFSVSDTGIGVAPENLKKIFQPFTQVDSTTTRKYGGTGLGLSICQRLVGLMSGEISATSQLGIGSCFTFRIPLPEVKNMIEAASGELDLKNYAWDKAPRVLVAEDIYANTKVIQIFLRKLGCEVIAAENGFEVLKALANQEFDLILMDCQMPGLDGYQTTQKIRTSSEKYKDIPIIATTANAITGDREKCLAAGMNDYLPKPLRLLELKRVLSRCLNLEKQNSDISTSLPPELDREKSTIIDWKILHEIEATSPGNGSASEIIELFLKNLPSRLQRISETIEAKDCEEIQKAVHALKSSASYIGAVRVQKTCDEIRNAVAEKNFKSVSNIFQTLSFELRDLMSQIEAAKRFW